MKISTILAVILNLNDPRSSMAFATSVHNFTSGNESILRKGSLGAPQLSVFCWRNQNPTLDKFWSIVILNFNISNSAEFKTHFGETYEEVEFIADTDAVFWFLREPPRQSNTITLSPFLTSCVGVTSDSPYVLDCRHVHFDILSFFLTLIGIFFYLQCNFFSRIQIIYITSSLFIQVFCSWLLLTSRISRNINWTTIISAGLKGLSMYLTIFVWYELYKFERNTLCVVIGQ